MLPLTVLPSVCPICQRLIGTRSADTSQLTCNQLRGLGRALPAVMDRGYA